MLPTAKLAVGSIPTSATRLLSDCEKHVGGDNRTPPTDDCALTVIRAPLGYGKTALLRQFQEQAKSGGPVLWVEASEVSTEQLAQQIADWATGLAQPATMIIDDYHAVSTPTLDRHVVQALESNPNARMVVAGHRFCALDTPFLTGRITSRVMGPAELVPATDPPAATDHGAATGRPAATDQPEVVAKKLGQLVEGLRTKECARQILWVLGLTGGTTLQVLNEAVVGCQGALEKTVTHLETTGLVYSEWRGPSLFYVAHPGLVSQDFLPSRAEVATQMRARALHFHAHQLARVDAVAGLDLLLSSGMYAEADQFAVAYFLRLSTDPERTYTLLRNLPKEELGSLVLLQGMRLLLGQDHPDVPVQTYLEWAKQAQQGVRDLYPGGLEEADAGHITILLSACRILGEWDDAQTLALALEEKLATHHYRSEWDGWSTLPLSYAVASLTGLLSGDLDMAERTARQALSISNAEDNPSEQVRSHHLIALLTAINGQVDLARSHLEKADQIMEATGCAAPEMSESHGLLAQVGICMLENDFKQGLVHLERLEPVLERLETWDKVVEIESWLMRFHSGNGAALRRLQQRIRQREALLLSPQGLASLTAMAANLSTYSGDLKAADTLLRNRVLETDEVILARSRLAFMEGDTRKAYRLASAVNRSPGGRAKNTAAVLLCATALFAAGDPAGALGELVGLNLSEEGPRLTTILSTVPYSAMRDLAASASDAGQSDLLDAVNALPETHRFQEPKPLTRAELRVLRAVGQGRTNPEAAAYLGLSLNTAKTQLRAVYGKMGVSSRGEALHVATMRGIL